MSQPATVRRGPGRPSKPIRPIADYLPADALPTPAPATTEQHITVYHHHEVEPLLWSSHDIAKALGIGERSARDRMVAGRFGEMVKIGAMRRVRRADVEAWIAAGGE